jgi:hypothetical protein
MQELVAFLVAARGALSNYEQLLAAQKAGRWTKRG